MADQSIGRLRGPAAPDGFSAAVAAYFPADVGRATIEPVHGGLSGSRVARVLLPERGCWAIKTLPRAMDRQRGRWLHRFMRHLRSGPLPMIPQVAQLAGGDDLWEDSQGRLWEMLGWMPGQPQPQPNAAEKAAAIAAVAAVHARAASFPAGPATWGMAASLRERAARCRQLEPASWERRLRERGGGLAAHVADQAAAERIETALATAADRLKWDGAAALQRMGAYEPQPEWLLTVVRDLRAEHLLFAEACSRSESQVSGLIDFHAARLDSPACDLGRLLASWSAGPPQPAVVRETVDAYAAAWAVGGGGRPLDGSQLCERIELIAASGVLLGLDNWVRWVAQEQRWFPDWSAVADRLEWHLEALPASLCRLQSTPVSA